MPVVSYRRDACSTFGGRMQILVLGMHRSGTSAVTRILNLGGAHLGKPHELIVAGPDNIKGFWERKDVVHLNDRVLDAVGLKWDNASAYNTGLFESTDLSRARRTGFQPVRCRTDLSRARARALRILDRLDQRGSWAIKDPRLCLTLPFWRPLLNNPLCIHVFREPAEVARSLAKRDGLPPPVAVALWEVYNRVMLANSAGLPCFAIHYNELLADHTRVTRQLFAWCQAHGARGLGEGAEGEIAAFMDRGLNHSSRPRGAPALRLSPEQADLAAALRQGDYEAERNAPVSEAALKILYEYDAQCARNWVPQRWWRLGRRLCARLWPLEPKTAAPLEPVSSARLRVPVR